MLNFEILSREEIFSTFPNEIACIKHLENLRWNNEVVSPFDPFSKVYDCKNQKYKCKNSGKYFNVKTNTIFHNSRIPLQKWFVAVWIVSVGKRKITSVALSSEIDITQKTAWFMLQRIKKFIDINKGFETYKAVPKKQKIPNPKKTSKIETTLKTPIEKLKMSDWLELIKNHK